MKTEHSSMHERRRFRRLTLAALAMLLVLGPAAWGWHHWRLRQTVAAARPDLPDVSTWPREMQERIRTADARTRSFRGAVGGLGDLARLYHANGFYEEAMECYGVLAALDPSEARWVHWHASILASLGRLDEAEPLFARAADLAPDHLQARVRLGDVLLKGNEIAAAARSYEGVLARDPAHPYAQLGLARCALATGDWGKARSTLQQAIARNPDFVGALSLMATVHDQAGETAAANELRTRIDGREYVEIPDPWIDALLDDCYDPYRLSVAAAAAGFRGERAMAENLLRRAVNLAPTAAPFHRQLGNLYAANREFAAARRCYEQAIALAPTDSDAWSRLVSLLSDVGERQSAYEKVYSGLEYCPESRALHHAYGRLLRQDGRYPEAIAQFREAKRLQPAEVSAYIELANVYFQLQREGDAVAELREALLVQPDHPIALVVLARVAVGQRDETAATEYVRRAHAQPKVRPEDLRQIVSEFQEAFGRVP